MRKVALLDKIKFKKKFLSKIREINFSKCVSETIILANQPFKQLLLNTLLSQVTPSHSNYTASNNIWSGIIKERDHTKMIDGVPTDKIV